MQTDATGSRVHLHQRSWKITVPALQASNPQPQAESHHSVHFVLVTDPQNNAALKNVSWIVRKIEYLWPMQKFKVHKQEDENRKDFGSVFFKPKGIKRTAFLVSYFTRTGVLKYYGSTCTFKITTIFLNKPFVGEATAKGV